MANSMSQNIFKLFYREENILIVNHRKGDVNNLKSGEETGFWFCHVYLLKTG